jgi:glucose/arabinose dehydrogenase
MTFHRFPLIGALATALAWLSIGAVARAQQGDGTDVTISAHVFKPNKVAPTPRRISQLRAPADFKVRPFATGLKNARVLAVAPDGSVYVSRREQGDVLLLRDTNGDGRADGTPTIVANRPGAHGIAVHDGKLYLITVKEIFVSDINPDGTLAGLQSIVGDLPDSGQHPNRTSRSGPTACSTSASARRATPATRAIPRTRHCCARRPTENSARSTRRGCAT